MNRIHFFHRLLPFLVHRIIYFMNLIDYHSILILNGIRSFEVEILIYFQIIVHITINMVFVTEMKKKENQVVIKKMFMILNIVIMKRREMID